MPIDYLNKLQGAEPTYFDKVVIPPPPGSMSAPTIIPEIVIPPLNTDVRFSSLRSFDLKKNPKIAQMAASSIPENFNWAQTTDEDSEQIKNKKKYIQKVGNQRLCGSCWAISSAQIISDNFVVSGIVDYDPKLSTTWILSNYPQGQCNGGNPAQLFEDAAYGGIASDHCIDYSWCSKNDKCNGNATKHFEAKKINLNTLIPPPGCYFNNSKHYVYKIEPSPKTVIVGNGGITPKNAAITVKKHIYNNGPVCGAFLVYKNFMKGNFCKTNSGIYFDRGIYDEKGNVTFSKSALSESNYAGAHAVAIIGWGVAKNIVYDETGEKADVPYWYCRNSWASAWGDNGYFKMAMYPFNKRSQFDKTVEIQINNDSLVCGGIIMLNVSRKPTLKKLKNVPKKILQLPKENDNDYYANETENIKKQLTKTKSSLQDENTPSEKITSSSTNSNSNSNYNFNKHMLIVILISIGILALIFFLTKMGRKGKGKRARRGR